jgi:hypothetical protein
MTASLIPTPEELSAIRALKRLAKRWPKSLWLFSASGNLHVMQTGENGERVMDHGTIADGGVNLDYLLATVDIPNDGGDW